LKIAGEYDSTVQLADGAEFSLALDIADLYDANGSTQTIWIKISEGDGSRWTIYQSMDINLAPLNPPVDTDADDDGIDDSYDQCPGHDDNIDIDDDGTPDGCDNLIDSDDDGIADSSDTCEGFDDSIDVDGDGTPDGCDDFIDSDVDGVADESDACEGFDDSIDVDGDGIPYGCDDLIDSDGDGVADGVDECANSVGYVEQNGCPPSEEDEVSSTALVVATGGGIGLGSLLLFFAWPGMFGRKKESDELSPISWSEPEPTGPPQLQEIGLSPPPLGVTGVLKGDGYEWYEWPKSSGDWWYRTAHTQNQWKYWEQ
jgi:hypothetical protein